MLFPAVTSSGRRARPGVPVVSAVSPPLVLPNQRQVQLYASCGLVTWESMSVRATADDLLRGAGLAVREARRAGRNHIEVCTPS